MMAKHVATSGRRALKMLYKSFFSPAARYPADPRAIFVLAFSVFTGLVALALGAAPDSLGSYIPPWAITFWALILVGGSTIALVGMCFQGINGIVTEQVGSVMISAATLFYAALAFKHVGTDALQTVGVIFAWGVACAVRWVQLQALINVSYKRKLQQELQKSITEGQ